MLTNNVKLVIWDLDDTFWRGTLSEGPITVPRENVEIVTTLSRRGIISSICSKNNYDDARQVLEECGAWPFFVFPRIEFASKGVAIAELIEQANLRADNVLFIDDSRLNLEEARYHAPNLMTANPAEILSNLLNLPQTKGKNDEKLTRLHQYKQLEKKKIDQQQTTKTNEQFLRECDIRVEIDVDVEGHFDRVIELVNRSNQLNFTKARLEGPEAIAAFRELLQKYGYHAGIVKASDKYGDYGIVGFFMTARFAYEYKLIHFVFSCRIMNMGIEQYVHRLLGCPECNIVAPVSNGLGDFADVDWIQLPETDGAARAQVGAAKLLLVGGCDLLQTAAYCSTNRVEYVNAMSRGVMVRYDDPGFVLSARDAIAASWALSFVPCWTKDDAARFDADLGDSEVIIASFWEALNGDYMLLADEIMLRIAPGCLQENLGRSEDGSYVDQVKFVRLSVKQKLELAARSFDRIADLSPRAKSRFLLSANIRGSTGAEQRRRMAYNATVAAYCKQRGTFDFVPIDDIVPKSEIINAQHFTRKGYFALASELMRRMDGGASVPLPTVMSSFSTAGLRDVANAGLPLVLANGRLRVPPWQWLSAMWRGGKEIRLRMDFGPVRTLAARPIAVARRMNSRTRQIRRAFGPGAVVD